MTSDPSLLVLASLAEGDKHGYAMIIDIEAFAGVASRPWDSVWSDHSPGGGRLDTSNRFRGSPAAVPNYRGRPAAA